MAETTQDSISGPWSRRAFLGAAVARGVVARGQTGKHFDKSFFVFRGFRALDSRFVSSPRHFLNRLDLLYIVTVFHFAPQKTTTNI